jgi:hypothetical protein
MLESNDLCIGTDASYKLSHFMYQISHPLSNSWVISKNHPSFEVHLLDLELTRIYIKTGCVSQVKISKLEAYSVISDPGFNTLSAAFHIWILPPNALHDVQCHGDRNSWNKVI